MVLHTGARPLARTYTRISTIRGLFLLVAKRVYRVTLHIKEFYQLVLGAPH
jgi:hypothetical protein